MPAVSQAQWRFMQGVKHGNIKVKGLPPKKAAEFVKGVDYKALPKHHRDALKRALFSRSR
jgi:hypothetical protein